MSLSIGKVLGTLQSLYELSRKSDSYIDRSEFYGSLTLEETEDLNKAIDEQAKNSFDNLIVNSITGSFYEVSDSGVMSRINNTDSIEAKSAVINDILHAAIDVSALRDISEALGAEQTVIEGIGVDPSTGQTYKILLPNLTAWDPRLLRVDSFLISGPNKDALVIVPYGTYTIASAFNDEVFSIERVVKDANFDLSKINKDTINSEMSLSASDSAGNYTYALTGQNTSPEGKRDVNGKQSDKVFSADETIKSGAAFQQPDSYGVASLMNPYTLTRLAGGISSASVSNEEGRLGVFENRMYDVRDTKRFYDMTVKNDNDYHTINNPTTTNIITWSNRDLWGRTPYSFLDFVFCKYWNIIPNNRLITLRKYHAPTYDNLNFNTMLDKGKNTYFAPLVTVVTYFGEETGNTLSNILSFTAGTPWEDLNADMHSVNGDTGSNPRAVIDLMFSQGGFGGVTAENNMVGSLLNGTGILSGKYMSLGKFLTVMEPGGYSGHSQDATDKINAGLRDPSEQLYSNKIIGPVNRVESTKKRKAGITFEHEISIVCEYVSRPIGGVNTKAAMLDIMLNCLEMGAVDAAFWGGGYKFMIHPLTYPWKRKGAHARFMDDLYAGRIFGSNGAIAHLCEGVLSFGKGANGDWDWSNVTEKLGNFLGLTLGAIGLMISSLASTIFGESNSLSEWINGKTEGNENAEKGSSFAKSKMKTIGKNLNAMWRDLVILNSMMPLVDGMKAILTGEPVGNWHLTVGNPLNPIIVVGNLICENVKIEFSDELGPDDFPLEMKATYKITHAMPRDKASISSMFNRGSGRIYLLPDFMHASSDYESKVDAYTGPGSVGMTKDGYYKPASFMQSSAIMGEGSKLGLKVGGYGLFSISRPTELRTLGNPETTFVTKFTPVSIDMGASNILQFTTMSSFINLQLEAGGNRAVYKGHATTRKLMY